MSDLSPYVDTTFSSKKTTRENGEKFSALNTPTAPQTQDEVPSLRQCC